jgi:hypothetical protein
MRVIKINHRFLANGDPKQRLLDMPPSCATVCSNAIDMIQYMQHFHTIDIPSLGFFISNQTLHVNKRVDYTKVFAFLHNYPWIEGLVIHHTFKNDDVGVNLGTAVSKYTFEQSPKARLKYIHVSGYWTKVIYQLMLDNRDSLEKYEGESWECNWTFPALTHLTIHATPRPLRLFKPRWFPNLLYLNLPKSWVWFPSINIKTNEFYGASTNTGIWRYALQQQKKHAAICETQNVLTPLLKRDATSLVVAWCARIPPSEWCIKPEEVPLNLYVPSKTSSSAQDWKPVINKRFEKMFIQQRRKMTNAKLKQNVLKRVREGDESDVYIQRKAIKINEQTKLLIKEYLDSLYLINCIKECGPLNL